MVFFRSRVGVLLLWAIVPQQYFALSTVSTDTFNQISRYTQFSSAAYADVCQTSPNGSIVVSSFSDNATDSQATIFRDDRAKEVIVAFRGSSSPKDLDTDLDFTLVPLRTAGNKCPNCKVHNGFQNAYNALAAQITTTVKSQLRSNPAYSLTVTGHSLGAGMAAIASPALATLSSKIQTYTYGEPRNGDEAYAQYIASVIPDSKYYRVTHANDGVPQIPPSVLGFQHHGSEYWEKETGHNNASTTFVCGNESTECNSSQDYGVDPINRAHLTYTNTVIGNSLYVEACGADWS